MARARVCVMPAIPKAVMALVLLMPIGYAAKENKADAGGSGSMYLWMVA